MISASLAVDRHAHGLGLPPHHHHHHHHRDHHHAMTFGEPFPPPQQPPASAAPKPPPPPEFLRPLPKPGPRYNGVVNGCRVVSHSVAPRVSTSASKYHHEPVPGAVNLTKSDTPDDYAYRFPISQPYYPGPYLYPTHYTPLPPRCNYVPPPPPPPQQQQLPPEAFRRSPPNSPGQFSPPSSPSKSSKRFKVPSGKEGSLKHRILTRPTESPNKRRATIHPPNFTRGSLIQLANGELKRVEDMRTEDFVSSAEKSAALRLDPSTVVRIEEARGAALLTLSYGEQRSQVDFETTVENPFFVFGRGWSSCSPERSLALYGLKCHALQVGDICISLTPRQTAAPHAEGLPRKRRWSAPEHFSDEEAPAQPQKKS